MEVRLGENAIKKENNSPFFAFSILENREKKLKESRALVPVKITACKRL